MTKLIVIGVLLLAVLSTYIYSVFEAVDFVKACKDPCKLPDNIGWTLNSVGGLVSAVAVSFLGIAKPGGLPKLGIAVTEPRYGSLIATVFVIVWTVCGLITFYYGVMEYHDKVVPLTAMGKVWLGTALAGIAAYLGIDTSNSQ